MEQNDFLVFPSSRKKKNTSCTHYRERIASFCYPEILKGIERVGSYNMPVIQANYSIPTISETTPFDRIAAKNSNHESLVIFFVNDSRFVHRLSHPWDYTEKLRLFEGVIGPDLSQYINMDYPRRLYNCYCNKVFTAFWQRNDVNMYPNVTWSLPDSYEYSVAGYPRKSVIAINSMGVRKDNISIALWLDGYHYMVKALDPICILRYGPKIFGEDEGRSIYLSNTQLNILRNGSKR